MGDTPWLDDDEMRAWRGLVEIFAEVRAALEDELVERHGLTEGDYGVLVQLSEAEGRRLRMCDLAARLHLSPSGLTRRLDGLVAMGLVERVPSPDDRRAILAALTPTGLRRLEEAAPDHVGDVRRHLLDHLTREQIRNLGEALDAVRAGRRASEPGVTSPEGAARTEGAAAG